MALALAMESAFILGGSSSSTSSDGFEWANVADLDPLHAWDFLTNQAKFSGVTVGPLANTPGWSYTRSDAQTAYAQTSAGVLTPFATGVLRRTDKGVLIEGARTNLCLWSDDWTNAAWTKTTCTAALDQTGPDGVANSATSLTATAGNATVLQSITSGSATRAASVYIKRIAGSGNIQMTVDGGAGWTTLTVTSSWTQVAITQAAVTNPSFGLRIVTNGDAVAVKFGMVENASFQSSPIPTTTASATRAADALTVPVSGIDYPISLFAEFERAVDTGTSSVVALRIADTGGTNNARLSINGSGLAQTYCEAAGVAQVSNTVGSATSVGQVKKLALRYSLNNTVLAASGSLGTLDTSCSLPAAPTTIQFAYDGSTQPLWGYLRRCALWTRALTDSELQTVTT